MKLWFSFLSLILISCNLLAVYYLDLQSARYVQLSTTAILLAVFILRQKIHKTVLFILILLTICDGLIIEYEDPLFRKFIYLTRITIYLSIIYFLYPYLSRLYLNLVTVIIAVFVISIDVYLLHDMALYIPTYTQDIVFTILFYMLGLSSLALVAACISYLNRYADTKGFLLVLVSISFVLSDITFYNAYYLGFEVFYYFDKTANIIGISSLIIFTEKWLNDKKSDLKTEI